MGIMVFHISREFDNIEAGQLSTLKDWLKSRKRIAGEGVGSMMILAIILIPALAGLASFFTRRNDIRRILLVAAAIRAFRI